MIHPKSARKKERKNMKIWKRLFCLLLSLVMILGTVSTVFAQTAQQSPNKPNYEYYVPMGTSITGGYRLPGDGTGGTVGKPDGVFSNEYTYAYLVGEEFDIDEHYSGALLGSRTLEYRMLLEEDFPEEDVDNYNNIWVGPRCGNDYDHLHNELGPTYRENLAKADIISVEIGLNDVTSYAMCTLMTELEEQVKESGEEDIFAYLESIGGEGGTIDSEEMLGILAIAQYLNPYEDILTKLSDYFIEGWEYYRTNFPIVLQDIREINPTADIFVIGVYNPLGYMLDHEITANENGNIDIKNLILRTGETLSLDAEQTTWLFNLMEEYVVGSQNIIMQDACRRNNATFVDIRGIDLSGSADGTHPYVAGHSFIAEHLADGIYSLYPCQHRHLTTYNVVTPTVLTPFGYTGNIYCVDCGAFISSGHVITYNEYIRQQQIGNVPTAEEVRGETVDPFVTPVDEPTLEELDGKTFIIAYQNRALGVGSNKGYTATTTTTTSYGSWSFETTTNATVSGLDGKTLQLDGDNKIDHDYLTKDILWTFEDAGNGKYRIKNNSTGQYLGGNSSSSGGGWNSSSTLTEDLFLTGSTDYSWSYSDSALSFQTGSSSRNRTTVYLAFDTPETAPEGYKGSSYFFTAHRDEGSDIVLYNVEAGVEEEPMDDDQLLAEAQKLLGKCVEWKQSGIGEGTFCLVVNNYAIGLDAGKGIAVQQISNASQIEGLGKRFQWKVEEGSTGYSFENIGNPGYYLSAYTESNMFTTRASLSVNTAPYFWQFTNNSLSTSVKARGFLNFSFNSTYYLSCNSGALSLATGAVSNTAKLYQAVKTSENHARLERTDVAATCTTDGSATFTCPTCGASVTFVTKKAFGHKDENPADGRCDVCGVLIGQEEEPSAPETRKPYSVTVDGKIKGYYDTGDQVTVTAGTKEHGIFTGWTATSGNSGRSLSATDLGVESLTVSTLSFTMTNRNVTLTSNWEPETSFYSVSVNGAKTYHQAGEIVNVSAGTREGFVCNACTVTDDSGASVTLGNLSFDSNNITFTMPDKNIVITPTWTQKVDYYTVKIGNQTTYYEKGVSVTVEAADRAGSIFKGWTAKDDQGADLSLTITAGDLSAKAFTFTMPEENVVLTENWTAQHKVTIDGKASYYLTGETVTLKAGTKENAFFKSWTVMAPNSGKTPEDLDVNLANTSFTMVDNDLTITSTWEKTTHTVKFVSNGGTAYDSLEVSDGYTLNLNSYRPTKSGYTFQRWNLDEDLTLSAGNSVTVNKDITLYASYTSNGFFGTGTGTASTFAGNLFSGITSFFNSFFRW